MKKIILSLVFVLASFNANADQRDDIALVATLDFYGQSCTFYGQITDRGYDFMDWAINKYGRDFYINSSLAQKIFSELNRNVSIKQCRKLTKLLSKRGLAR